MQGMATYSVASSPQRAAGVICFLLGNADWCCCGQCNFLEPTYRSVMCLVLDVTNPVEW